MPGRFRRLLFAALCLCAASLRAATPAAKPSVEVHLGDSVVALNGPWKFIIGDSPTDPVTGKPLWSSPTFDDSAWETLDLTPPPGSTDPIAGTTGYLPGWTARGHKDYWGYAWYRIRVRVDSRPGTRLALAGPSDVDDIYQFFDNGAYIGAFGDFSTNPPSIFTTRPEMFFLPDPNATEATDHIFAFRVYMEPYTLNQLDDVGGFHNPPLLGEHSAVAAQNQVKWDELYLSYSGNLIEMLLFGLLSIIAFSLILFDRSEPLYLWLGGLLLLITLSTGISVLSTWSQKIPYYFTGPIRIAVITPFIYVGWLVVWRVWFRLRRPRWIPWAAVCLLPLLIFSTSLGQNLFFVLVPPAIAHPFQILSLAVRLVIAVLLIWTVIQGIREQGLEGLVAVPPVLLASIAEFSSELGYIHILPTFFPFGLQLTARQVANLLLVLALSLLLLRRLSKNLRRQRQIALDVKQAQEVQQVILPEQHTTVPGLEIESEYIPALEVGGDFFQIIPNPADNSLLIVAGDVAGKGLKAGMLVALLVGAIRTVAQFDPNPIALLDALNQRLLGRGDAFATCLALRIAADGRVTLANAGHLAPYVNGKALELEGSLPLGMLQKPEFSLMHFTLAPGDRLFLLSDGVVEATDATGHLLGFEQVEQLLTSAPSAAQIAATARRFGQQDDISVISVTRTAVATPATAVHA